VARLWVWVRFFLDEHFCVSPSFLRDLEVAEDAGVQGVERVAQVSAFGAFVVSLA
jgi:hypothetical protein